MISPKLTFVQKGFVGLFSGGLIFGGVQYWLGGKFTFQILVWA